jgi:hypothetical protein
MTDLDDAVFGQKMKFGDMGLKYIRNDVILQNEPEAEDRVEDQGFSNIDNEILEKLEMMPFVSIRRT